jgi:membrane protein
MAWFKRRLLNGIKLFRFTIWTGESVKDTSARGRVHALLRILSITARGLDENRAASRAAALSFSSLLGLGPIIALTTMVAGFMLDDKNPDLAAETVNRVIQFAVPQMGQLEKANANAHATGASSSAPTDSGETESATLEVDPGLISFINGFIASSRNGAVGALGALTLILIVLQLFTSIETAFNEIWGVRQGRSWLMRVVYYWTIISLGAVLFFAALTGLSAGAFMSTFAETLPFGSHLAAALKFLLPVGSFFLLVVILTLFYRAIPNTHVFWMPALAGALIVGMLMFANNYLAFLYISRVLLSRALYGSLAIPIVLMFGLYVFWFFVLLGGQVSYAMQNVRVRNSQALWNNLAESTRERLSLAVLLKVCRRFHACLPPPTASELGNDLGVPGQLLNECLNRLVLMKLLTPLPAPAGEPEVNERYQPSRPLGRTTLSHFKRLDDDLGGDPTGPQLNENEPILVAYNRVVSDLSATDVFNTPLDRLFDLHPYDVVTGSDQPSSAQAPLKV